MWLINATTHKLHGFVEPVPPYVILSHTWGDDEVTFDDIGKLHAKDMNGYKKIEGCCKLALRDGFEWAWIDTCCIDKRSSAELSEAINSMYKWYWQAAICYAYLSDVSSDREAWKQEVKISRWFQRGWTLQELLAPDVVEFYDLAWVLIGSKSKLLHQIEPVTKIEAKYLLNREAIRHASIATTFSWAAHRKTTRVEDRAYCLLGLVHVNMPMLYGEGYRAFYRLQLEIIRQSNEHSIFAWEATQEEWQTTSVLAPSPSYFNNSGHLRPRQSRTSIEEMTHQITNNGLRITLRCIRIDQKRVIALLDCQDENEAPIGIWLQRVENEKYMRLPTSKPVALSLEEELDAEVLHMYLVLDNDQGENSVSPPSQIGVGEILTDRYLAIRSIVVSTGQDGTFVQDRHEGRNKYFLQHLNIQEGGAAYVRIQNLNHLGLGLLFGLLNGKVGVLLMLGVHRADYGSSLANFAEEMRLNSLELWDVIGDYSQVSIRIGPEARVIVRVEAKKKRSEGQIHWTLAVKAFECACGAIEDSGNDCVCDVSRKDLRPLW